LVPPQEKIGKALNKKLAEITSVLKTQLRDIANAPVKSSRGPV
jgi:hypothetical protein